MELVIMKKHTPVTTSIKLSEALEVEHRAIVRLIRKYKDQEDLGTSDFKSQKLKTLGRETEYYFLTEEEAIFILTLMRNSKKIVKFKRTLTSAFIEQRKLISKLLTNNQNLEWLEKRKETKVIRRELTDMIQEFIEYAKNQGSKSAEKYYMSISRMELTGLFLLEQKYPNYRDLMDFKQLNLIETADELIARSLKEAMNQGLNYKKCYAYAKEQIGRLAALFPKSPLPKLLENHSI